MCVDFPAMTTDTQGNTMKIITLQPAGYVDNLWGSPDGQIVEGTRQPYPYEVSEDGEIQNQEFWNGTPQTVLGFAAQVDVHKINLWWRDVVKEPQCAVGMYVVTRDASGGIATWPTAIESVSVIEVPA